MAGPAQLEAKYVHSVYATIAHTLRTPTHRRRGVQWPRVRQFLLALDAGSICVDVGCGTGKYTRANRAITVVNVDVTPGIYANGLLADALALPLRTASVDACISVAVVHHMSTVERRRRAIAEMLRVVRTGGRVLVCVWAYEQATRQFAAQDVLVPLYLCTGKFVIVRLIGSPVVPSQHKHHNGAACDRRLAGHRLIDMAMAVNQPRSTAAVGVGVRLGRSTYVGHRRLVAVDDADQLATAICSIAIHFIIGCTGGSGSDSQSSIE